RRRRVQYIVDRIRLAVLGRRRDPARGESRAHRGRSAGPTQGERLMSDDFRVNPDSLDRDATTWGAWSSDLEGLRDSIPGLGTGLDRLAFSILPNAQQVAAAYNSATRALVDSLDDGIGQFDGIATKLGDSATA